MKNFAFYTKKSAWLSALLLTIAVAGCGGGKWDSSPQLTPTGTPTSTPTSTPVVPTVTDSTPDDNATAVATTAAVSVTFSSPMDATTINDTTFTLTAPDTTTVAAAVSYSADTMTASLTPTNALEFNTTYTAEVTNEVRNTDGEALASALSWTFTTAAGVDSTEINPLNGSIEVCINKTISATFSDPLNQSTIVSPALNFTLAETLTSADISGVVSLNMDGTVATFTPDQQLAPDVEYTATITTDVEDMDGNALAEELVWTFTTSDTFCQPIITLGATEPYGVLSNVGVTLGGGPNSTTGLRVDGDVGIFPAGACIGCDTTTVSGVIEIGNTAAEDAITALEAAYDETVNLATNVCTLIDSGVLTTNPPVACGGGADGVFSPGLYWSGSSIAIPAGGTITLDGGNDNNAVFIFQSESTIDTIGGDTHMILQNGAQAKNVFWVAQSSATIGGTNSDFAGTVMALIGITVNTGTDMVGRALARGAEVVVQDEVLITVPAQ